MADDFDPAAHRRHETRWFDDFALGERFVLPSRTMTEAIFLAFQAASGDNHPIHYDVEYCRRHGMPHMLAHGYQILVQTAAGAGSFPFMVEDSLMGFIEQSSKFLSPVYVGDTLWAETVVLDSRPSGSRPEAGIIQVGTRGLNQQGDVCVTFRRTAIVMDHRKEITTVVVALQGLREPLDLRRVDVAHPVRHLFRCPDFQSLPLLDRRNEVGSLQQRVGRSSIQPGDATS